jgi:hypothetical protein
MTGVKVRPITEWCIDEGEKIGIEHCLAVISTMVEAGKASRKRDEIAYNNGEVSSTRLAIWDGYLLACETIIDAIKPKEMTDEQAGGSGNENPEDDRRADPTGGAEHL